MEGLRKELEEYAKFTSGLFAKFKVKFYGSAIKKLVTGLSEKKKDLPVIVMKINPDNRLYLIPDGDKLTFIYGLNFGQETDKALVRVFLQELEDAKRHVKNCIDSKYFPDTTKPPLELKEIEKNPGQFSSGFLAMSN